MYNSASIMFMHSITSLHVGSGTSVSTVDLPIQREKFTNFPVVAGSGVKGAIREYFEKSEDKKHVEIIFGPEKDGSDFAGAVSFSDAKILLFPVKSLKGVFAWVTCPMVIERFNRDMKIVNPAFSALALPGTDKDSATVGTSSDCIIERKVILEDYELALNDKNNKEVDRIAETIAGYIFKNATAYWADKLKKSLIVLNDDAFKEFVEYSTEIQTRIKIGENGVVENGALFYEENIPAETVFYSVVLASNPHKKDFTEEISDSGRILGVIGKLDGRFIHIGGDTTIGKGLTAVYLTGGK
ncbi:MAG: type III-B CRISPR module RAMP protein Cmr4 [Ignavibacteria bacterium]